MIVFAFGTEARLMLLRLSKLMGGVIISQGGVVPHIAVVCSSYFLTGDFYLQFPLLGTTTDQVCVRTTNNHLDLC